MQDLAKLKQRKKVLLVLHIFFFLVAISDSFTGVSSRTTPGAASVWLLWLIWLITYIDYKLLSLKIELLEDRADQLLSK